MTATKTAPEKSRRNRRRTDSERRRVVDGLRGKYSWIPYSSDDFERDKRREIALENRA